MSARCGTAGEGSAGPALSALNTIATPTGAEPGVGNALPMLGGLVRPVPARAAPLPAASRGREAAVVSRGSTTVEAFAVFLMLSAISSAVGRDRLLAF